MMIIDPLDWTAQTFLAFYVCLAAAAVIGIMLLRRRTGETRLSGTESNLGLLELAWLTGGRQRAADTVIVGLFASGAAFMGPKARTINVDTSAVELPKGLEDFRDAAPGVTTRNRFHKDIRTKLESVHDALVRRGLVPGPDDIARLRRATALLVAIPLLVGITRAVAGASRDRPIGILVFLLAITALFGLWMLAHLPVRTPAGTLALQQNRARHGRAARAPREPELALAFAITGAAVLAGTPYAAFARQTREADGGGGGCGGGGDGGGGGCGGGGCGGRRRGLIPVPAVPISEPPFPLLQNRSRTGTAARKPR